MSDRKNKSRGSNFSKDDELLLIDEVYILKEVVECKSTNKISNAEKDQAWKTIRDNFNAKSGLYRSIDQLKSKFDNLKTKARKIVSQRRTYIKGTGGGPSGDDGLDAVIEAILKIINVKTVMGLPSAFDCDDSMIIQEQNTMPALAVLEESPAKPTLIAKPYPESINVDILNFEEVLYTASSGDALEQSPPIITDVGRASTSKNEVPLLLPALKGTANNCTLANGSSDVLLQTPATAFNKAKHNWSSYAVKNLKEPVAKKLKPTIPNPVIVAKQNYYSAKALLFQEELKVYKARAAREEAEHEQKMKLLQLEIQIKEAELKKHVNK